MGFFGNSKSKDALILVFDIGSSSVGVAFFRKQSNNAPKIIYSTRESFLTNDNLDSSKLLDLALKSLKVIATRASLSKIGNPDKVFCVLSSPWYASQSRNIRMTKDIPFIVTKELVDTLVKNEINSFETEYKKMFQNQAGITRTIDVRIMKTSLNGYKSMEPINKKTIDMEMVVFLSIANTEIVNKISEAINRHFVNLNIQYSSFLMSAYTASRDLFINQNDFLLVNIGGEITEVSMIKKEVLLESSSFPLGSSFIIKGIAKELNMTLNEAKSIISLNKDNHLENNSTKNILEVMNKIKLDWLSSFQNTLLTLTKDISVPSTIFITVNDNLAPFFTETIMNEQFNQYSLTESKFRVISIITESLHGLATFEEGIDRDSPLLIESIYINNFLI